MYQESEGRNTDYRDRMNDQEEIKQFIQKIFSSGTGRPDRMDYKQYALINTQISSEMFYSLMAILHERLPCSPNFYKLKR